jgi:hypothetical protein
MILFLIIFLLLLLLYIISYNNNNVVELFANENILDKANRKFPYRYFKDENNNVLPIVGLSAFFRNDNDKELYYNYLKNDIKVIGITAYKTFPQKIRDISEDKYHLNDDFDYLNNIKVWLACMKNLELYNFKNNVTMDISESDFYDSEETINFEKKYDFIYICNKDADNCPLDGWNAINRNYNLALKCFPIMVNEYNLKGLCVGRIGCDLNMYSDNITVTDFLPYEELQEKMRESKFLFLPNIYDASPRVVAECLIKDVPVLMNQNIICGFKYVNYETGDFFIDENNIRNGLDNILLKINNNLISPNKWWKNNYGVTRSSKKLRDFLYIQYPNILDKVKSVSFII